MSSSTPQQTPSGAPNPRSRHRFKRGRGRGQQNSTSSTHEPSDADTNASAEPQAEALSGAVPPFESSQTANTNSRGNGQRGRGGRGGRPSRRGGIERNVIAGPGGRVFGGQLTREQQIASIPMSGPSPASLHADSPEFRPGQPVRVRSSQNRKEATAPPRPRRPSKSNAPDIASRTHEDIANGLYECPICTSEVLRNSKVWSCKTCWTVFHLSCIKKWSKNEGSTQQRQQVPEGEIPPPRQWRCPGCNLPKDELPTSYTCWCAKEIDPKPIPGLPPHSCGQTCSKPRTPRKCPHPCELLCHAGPCPPCPHMGPKMSCYCGKESVARRCVDTNYEAGWSCGKICGDLMPCGEHTCKRGCHEGLCGSCDVLVESRCYCGKVAKAIRCSERGEQKESSLRTSLFREREIIIKGIVNPNSSSPSDSTEESTISKVQQQLPESDKEIYKWVGSFDCGSTCSRPYDCKKHYCEQGCHVQTATEPHCPLSPDIVKSCPCGKTRLADMDCERESCEDPVPFCEKLCLRRLPCGHQCRQKCHNGDCKPCEQVISVNCRCGRTTSDLICYKATEEPPECSRFCKTLLNCGRHECGKQCCPGEKAASERQAAKRKQRSNANTGDDFEAEHICTRTCGRVLKCGNPEHTCQELCHRGQCGSCREAIFDELACNCGRTILHPPLPCGTQPPACQYQCTRPKACGHPQVSHGCHGDNESCPKCPYLVQKACMCGKKILKNQPCWSTQISCGQTCGHKLRCGLHFCQKPCHRPGECEDADGRTCPHPCGQMKTAAGCGHLCLEPCHGPYPCKEDKPCQAKVLITCDCQNLKQEVRCLATKSNPSPTRTPLPCSDECLRLKRNAALAAALHIPADHLDDHIPYSPTTLSLYTQHPSWCSTHERSFRLFAADGTEKRLRFKPIPSSQRAFLHALAEDFGLDSESVDPEPHRHVVVFKSPRFVSAPMKTLAQCVKIRQSSSQEAVALPKPSNVLEAYNAIILSNPRFALTAEELRGELSAELKKAESAGKAFAIDFLPSEEVVIHSAPGTNPVDENGLKALKPLVVKTVLAKKLAESVALCRVDHSLNVMRREDEMDASDGWSQVVKGAPFMAAPRGPGIGGKSAFTVLGGLRKKREDEEKMKEKERARAREKEKEKEKEKEDVVENWESAMEGWEET